MPLADASRFILWDFDGTLAVREGLWSQCIAEVVDRRYPHLGVSRKLFSPHLQQGFPWHNPECAHPQIVEGEAWWLALYPVLTGAVVAGAALSEVEASGLACEVRLAYLDPKAWRVFPDVEPCLLTLRARGWQHVVLSNHVPELPRLLSDLGLAQHFAFVFSSALRGYEKPHAEAYRSAVRALPAGAQVVMVGDSFACDVEGAQKVGIPAILVRGSSADACASVASLDDLPAFLEARNSSTEQTSGTSDECLSP